MSSARRPRRPPSTKASTPATAWPLPDRAAFVPFAAKAASKARLDEHDDDDDDDEPGRLELFHQQRFCRDYLAHDGPYRGLLLYHGLGSGKSCSAIAAAEALRIAGGRKVYVMLSASLRPNYVREVRVCGGRMFRESQSWRLVREGPELEASPAAWRDAVSARIVSAHGGLWTPVSEALGGVPYDQLSVTDRSEVLRQVGDAIARTHHFLHYNGLTAKAIASMVNSPNNPFDDAVVVIDEVHNFVSNLAGGKMVAAIYDRLMQARRCKLVMLSGTPLVNAPEELAHLVNLAAGPLTVHDVPIGPAGLTDAAEARVRACPYIHEVWQEPRSNGARQVACLRLVPEGFVRAPGDVAGTMVVRDVDAGADAASQLREAIQALGDVRPSQTAVRTRQLELLPSDADAFRAAFVSRGDDVTLMNTDILARRILGTISYFSGHAASLYPTLRSIDLVRLPLSPRQFSEYTTQRAGERRREIAARRYAAMHGSGSGSGSGVGMRPFSRAVCTFVFPEGVVRPRKNAAAAFGEEEDPNASDVSPDKKYAHALDDAIEALRHLAPDQLACERSGGRLAELSPKFDSIVSRLRVLSRGRGTAIVYSQFRRAEGVAILAVALEANGFARMAVVRGGEGGGRLTAELMLGGRVLRSEERTPEVLARPRYIMYSNDDPEASSALLSVFNNRADSDDVPQSMRDALTALASSGSGRRTAQAGASALSNLKGRQACAMLMTRSGAEGINTRNVREVHVIEPFWHANRVGQVIGRARRAYSHDDLPSEERTVDVFVYVATFTSEQAKAHRGDKGMTSDEHVHDVAQRKRKLLAGLLKVMQSAAVDCSTNEDVTGVDACFSAPTGARADESLYHVDIAYDLAAAAAATAVAAGYILKPPSRPVLP